jgi:hypothetical protein
MSNTTFWGPHAWNFFHHLPWLFPNEVLETKDAVAVLRFCHTLPKLLPCVWCSESAQGYEKDLGLFTSFTYDINDLKIVTRSNIAKYFFDLHNKVNVKLGYPTLKGTWRESVKSRKDWKESMFIFLMASCWNIPENDTPEDIVSEYYTFFNDLLPRILSHKKIGTIYAEVLANRPLTKKMVSKRHLITKWIYDMKVATLDGKSGKTWDYVTTDLFFESFKAKVTNCHPTPEEKVDENVKGCF